MQIANNSVEVTDIIAKTEKTSEAYGGGVYDKDNHDVYINTNAKPEDQKPFSQEINHEIQHDIDQKTGKLAVISTDEAESRANHAAEQGSQAMKDELSLRDDAPNNSGKSTDTFKTSNPELVKQGTADAENVKNAQADVNLKLNNKEYTLVKTKKVDLLLDADKTLETADTLSNAVASSGIPIALLPGAAVKAVNAVKEVVNTGKAIQTGIKLIDDDSTSLSPVASAKVVDNQTGFSGRPGFELKSPKYQPSTRNDSTTINGLDYSGHALDQMQSRGLVPSVIENALKNGESYSSKMVGRTIYYDSQNNISVITEKGKILTTYPGKAK